MKQSWDTLWFPLLWLTPSSSVLCTELCTLLSIISIVLINSAYHHKCLGNNCLPPFVWHFLFLGLPASFVSWCPTRFGNTRGNTPMVHIEPQPKLRSCNFVHPTTRWLRMGSPTFRWRKPTPWSSSCLQPWWTSTRSWSSHTKPSEKFLRIQPKESSWPTSGINNPPSG